jgi:hypothetical protein
MLRPKLLCQRYPTHLGYPALNSGFDRELRYFQLIVFGVQITLFW